MLPESRQAVSVVVKQDGSHLPESIPLSQFLKLGSGVALVPRDGLDVLLKLTEDLGGDGGGFVSRLQVDFVLMAGNQALARSPVGTRDGSDFLFIDLGTLFIRPLKVTQNSQTILFS